MREHAFHLITSGRLELARTLEILGRIPPKMLDILHIREKQRSARELLGWYHKMREAVPEIPIYVNDRLDTAAAVRAPGVQLGFTSLPLPLARSILPAGIRIGCSVHSAEEAREAEAGGADYVLYGHIYPTASKKGAAPRGICALEEVVRSVNLPVIAIGGIRPEHVNEVCSTGCAGIAVMSSVWFDEDPGARTAEYREALDAAKHKPRRIFL